MLHVFERNFSKLEKKNVTFFYRFRVRLGEYDLDTEIDCNNSNGRRGLLPNAATCADPPLNVDVEEIIVHPLYNNRKKINDIALLRLARNISYTGNKEHE